MFSVCFRVRRHGRRRNDFCCSRQNRLSFNLDIWDKDSIGLGKYVLDDILVTLTQVHGCDIDKQKFACPQDKVRTTQPITTKFSSWNFFSRSNTIGHISGMVGPIDVKRKGCASVRYWVNYVNLTFDLTHDLDL